jgi:hypothetical protein
VCNPHCIFYTAIQLMESMNYSKYNECDINLDNTDKISSNIIKLSLKYYVLIWFYS